MAERPIPRRLSTARESEFYDPHWIPRVGVLLDGQPQRRVVEYDMDGGWIDLMTVPFGPRQRLHGAVTALEMADYLKVKAEQDV